MIHSVCDVRMKDYPPFEVRGTEDRGDGLFYVGTKTLEVRVLVCLGAYLSIEYADNDTCFWRP